MQYARSLSLSIAIAGVMLVPAVAASAHPGFRPSEVAADAQNDVELVISHGCLEGDEEVGSATRLVAPQWADGVAVEPAQLDGWTGQNDGDVTEWVETGGATTDPILFPLTVTVAADVAPGDLLLSVYQECVNGASYNWQAGPDEEGDPGVRLTILPAGSPAAVRTEESVENTTAGHDGPTEPTQEAATDVPGTASPTSTGDTDTSESESITEPTPDDTVAAAATPTPDQSPGSATGEATLTATPQESAQDDNDSSRLPWILAIGAAIAVAAAAPWLVRSRDERNAVDPEA